MNFDKWQRKIERVILGNNNGVNKKNDSFGSHWFFHSLSSFVLLALYMVVEYTFQSHVHVDHMV